MSDTARLAAFLALTLAMAWFSRASLRAPRSHGFWRFFAWECFLGLVLLALPAWFADPLAPRQLLSWALLLVSGLLALHGFHLLRAMGRPSRERAQPGLIGVERTTRLVTKGAFHLIRHPLYTSLMLLSWGAFLKSPGWAEAALAGGATAFLYLTARAEEEENLRYFVDEYRAYMRPTRMFIPWVW